MENEIRKNEKCFIGMPSCGYGYESAKSCFLAAPAHASYTLKIEAIQSIIEAQQYECHIALRRIDPGTFAFCTKICSKIIQSQFCIVLLDPSFEQSGGEYPNPNVHFEYGMMIGQNKQIIPLQDEKYDLAFNISPLDTIKYNDSNFKIKVQEAVDNAIKKSTEVASLGKQLRIPEVFLFYNFLGFELSDTAITFYNILYEYGKNLGFYLFDNKREKKIKYFASFHNEDPKLIVLHTKLLIEKVTSTYERLETGVDDQETKKKYGYLKDTISIDIIVPPFYEKQEVGSRISEIADNKFNYPINIYYLEDIQEEVNNKYKEVGDLKVIKPKKS